MKTELKKLAGLFSERMRASKCEACGKEFTCGASLKGCWCSEVVVSDETRANLKAAYQDCLCRECLEKAAQSDGR